MGQTIEDGSKIIGIIAKKVIDNSIVGLEVGNEYSQQRQQFDTNPSSMCRGH